MANLFDLSGARERVKMRKQCIAELTEGHLLLGMKIMQNSKQILDEEIKSAAVAGCIKSLELHFHWCIPIVVEAFGIAEDARLNPIAAKIIHAAFDQGNYPLMVVVAQTFKITLSQNIIDAAQKMILDEVDRQVKEKGAVYFTNESLKYK